MPGQAIRVKFLGPTNFRGDRLRAMAQTGSITISWNYTLNRDANFERAAAALRAKMGWDGQWAGGWLPDGTFAAVRCDK